MQIQENKINTFKLNGDLSVRVLSKLIIKRYLDSDVNKEVFDFYMNGESVKERTEVTILFNDIQNDTLNFNINIKGLSSFNLKNDEKFIDFLDSDIIEQIQSDDVNFSDKEYEKLLKSENGSKVFEKIWNEELVVKGKTKERMLVDLCGIQSVPLKHIFLLIQHVFIGDCSDNSVAEGLFEVILGNEEIFYQEMTEQEQQILSEIRKLNKVVFDELTNRSIQFKKSEWQRDASIKMFKHLYSAEKIENDSEVIRNLISDSKRILRMAKKVDPSVKKDYADDRYTYDKFGIELISEDKIKEVLIDLLKNYSKMESDSIQIIHDDQIIPLDKSDNVKLFFINQNTPLSILENIVIQKPFGLKFDGVSFDEKKRIIMSVFVSVIDDEERSLKILNDNFDEISNDVVSKKTLPHHIIKNILSRLCGHYDEKYKNLVNLIKNNKNHMDVIDNYPDEIIREELRSIFYKLKNETNLHSDIASSTDIVFIRSIFNLLIKYSLENDVIRAFDEKSHLNGRSDYILLRKEDLKTKEKYIQLDAAGKHGLIDKIVSKPEIDMEILRKYIRITKQAFIDGDPTVIGVVFNHKLTMEIMKSVSIESLTELAKKGTSESDDIKNDILINILLFSRSPSIKGILDQNKNLTYVISKSILANFNAGKFSNDVVVKKAIDASKENKEDVGIIIEKITKKIEQDVVESTDPHTAYSFIQDGKVTASNSLFDCLSDESKNKIKKDLIKKNPKFKFLLDDLSKMPPEDFLEFVRDADIIVDEFVSKKDFLEKIKSNYKSFDFTIDGPEYIKKMLNLANGVEFVFAKQRLTILSLVAEELAKMVSENRSNAGNNIKWIDRFCEMLLDPKIGVDLGFMRVTLLNKNFYYLKPVVEQLLGNKYVDYSMRQKLLAIK